LYSLSARSFLTLVGWQRVDFLVVAEHVANGAVVFVEP
jgi:hypothetical protein